MEDTDEMNVQKLENEVIQLRQLLKQKEIQLRNLKKVTESPHKLTNDEIARYSRQIILPNFGVSGQLKLKKSSVLIVGAGGLGCPSGLYLTGAGVGKIGMVDYDEVEINNLHRQLLFTERDIKVPKAEAARDALLRLNSSTEIVPYRLQLSSTNAMDIIADYDIVLDATDNVVTRYLLNDACVLSKKPLVSGSALQLEGQLTVYNYANGPCYRCLFPTPPPPETVTNCGDGGVIGAVTGVIGALQALETIKIILGHSGVLSSRLLLFDGENSTFRSVKLRNKSAACAICSDIPTITKLIDYEQFCGSQASDKNLALNILDNHERVSVSEFKSLLDTKEPHLLIDVRSPNEYEICRLESSINFPVNDILDENRNTDIFNKLRNSDVPVFVVCRRGNDSQRVVRYLNNALDGVKSRDLSGGLHAWTTFIDPNFPVY